MFNSSIIEVVIGLIFIFAFLAILVTQINTLITNLLKIRSKQLKEGLVTLIGDKRLQAEMLIHPLIKMVDTSEMMLLSLQVSEDMADDIIDKKATGVTWINPETFVDALQGVLISRSQDSIYAPFYRIIDSMPPSDERARVRESFNSLQEKISETNLRRFENDINAVTDPAIKKKLLDAFNDVDDLLLSIRSRSDDLIPLLNGIKSIKTPAFRQALEMIVSTADNIEEAREKLKNWFDDGMGRTSEKFRRLVSFINIFVAVFVVILLNADTLAMARSLWENDELRTNIVTTAREFDSSTLDPALTTPATPEPTATGDNGGSDSGATTDEDLTFEDIVDQAQQDVDAIEATLQTLLELDLPLGWEYVPVTPEMIQASQQLGLRDPRDNPRNLWNLLPWNNSGWFSLIFLKLVGLAATAIAAAQGAPFWFGLLGRLTPKSGS